MLDLVNWQFSLHCMVIFLAGQKGQLCMSKGDSSLLPFYLLPLHSSNFQCHTDIWELIEGINPNPFSNEKDITLEPPGVPVLHPRSQELPPKSGKSSWWMPNLSFSIVKIERSGIHQIESIFQAKSIGTLKIT